MSQRVTNMAESATLKMTQLSRELKAQGIDVISLSIGEPDFNTPEHIKEAAKQAIDNNYSRYSPVAGYPELRNAIVKKLKEENGLEYNPTQISCANGAKQSVCNVIMTLVDNGDEVIVPAPFWVSYPEMVKLSDGVPVIITGSKEQNYKVSAAQIEAAVTDKTKALVLNTPSNPTGMVYTREELEAIAEVAVRKDFYVVADEMYEHLIYGDDKHVSIASLNEEIYKRTITCSGLSKSYSMTGWRVGYTGASVEITKRMSAMQSHATSNPNSIAQKAALEALVGPQDAIAVMRKEFDARRKYSFERVRNMPHVDCIEPKGAFYVFVDVSKVQDMKYKGEKVESAAKMADILLNEFNVAVIPCADFGFADHIRLSYAISMEQIEKGLNRIEDFLNTLE